MRFGFGKSTAETPATCTRFFGLAEFFRWRLEPGCDGPAWDVFSEAWLEVFFGAWRDVGRLVFLAASLDVGPDVVRAAWFLVVLAADGAP